MNVCKLQEHFMLDCIEDGTRYITKSYSSTFYTIINFLQLKHHSLHLFLIDLKNFFEMRWM